MNDIDADIQSRLQERARFWRVHVEDVRHTSSSVVATGHRDNQPIVLKIVRRRSDERISGAVLDAFDGRGMVRALEYDDGALLLERLVPGRSLADERTDDDRATAIIADVIGRMSPGAWPSGAPAIGASIREFERYATDASSGIPASLVEAARSTYAELCASQAPPRLLHGDLHHYNVLLDARRGWLAIDPKGVVGEQAYEVGAALRNPCDRPDVFASPATIERRVDCFARELRLDATRVLRWAFAQAVLAAIRELEDDGVVRAGAGWIAFARSVQAVLTDANERQFLS